MLIALPCIAAAQDPDARLRALEAQVEQLKKRIEALEGSPPAPAGAAAPASPSQAECKAAEQLKMSMSQAEVRRVMGEPSKVETTPLRTLFRYPCGTAYFDADTRRFVGFEQAR